MNYAGKLAALGIAAALAVGLSACSSHSAGDGTAAPSEGNTASAFAADVSFAQAMIPHHQQALAMARMALDPDSQASAEVEDLAARIQSAQGPEIEQMTMWLDGWDQPTAMPGATSAVDMMGMDHDMGGLAVSGMMSEDDMAALDRLSGSGFDQEWLQMMIEHHKGAVAMAEQAKGATLDPRVAALANDVITGQQDEIATMQRLLP